MREKKTHLYLDGEERRLFLLILRVDGFFASCVLWYGYIATLTKWLNL